MIRKNLKYVYIYGARSIFRHSSCYVLNIFYGLVNIFKFSNNCYIAMYIRTYGLYICRIDIKCLSNCKYIRI